MPSLLYVLFVGFICLLYFLPTIITLVLWVVMGNRVFTDLNFFPPDGKHPPS